MNLTECLLQEQNTEFLLRQDNADERLTRKAFEIGTAKDRKS